MSLRIISLFISIFSIHTCYGQFELNGRELAPYQVVSGNAAQIELTSDALNAIKDTFEISYRDISIQAQFNNNGMLVKEIMNDISSSSETTIIKEYEGSLLKKEHRLANKVLYETILYDYNAENKKKSALYTDAQGHKKYIKTYTYQGDTVIMEETFFYERNISTKEEFHYNESGKMTQHCSYGTNGEKRKCRTSSYDTNGRIIAETYALSRENGLEVVQTKKLYYENNFLTKEEVNYTAAQSSVPINYKYSFDDKGNWTSMVYYVNGSPEYFFTRKITYR